MEVPYYIVEINRRIEEMHGATAEIYEKVTSFLEKPLEGRSKEICEMAGDVIAQEERVQDMCMDALIRHQPFAGDLRSVASAMRVSYDLARISRYLNNVVQVAVDVGPGVKIDPEVVALLKNGYAMVRESVISYLSRDPQKAQSVIEEDNKIDSGYRSVLGRLAKMQASGAYVLLNGLVARIIERMADHACYISAETIYLTTGKRIGVRSPKCSQ